MKNVTLIRQIFRQFIFDKRQEKTVQRSKNWVLGQAIQTIILQFNLLSKHNFSRVLPSTKYLTVLLCCCFMCFSTLIHAQTYAGNATFNSQADVDAWDPIYIEITGNVTIEGSDITNLTTLSNLATIGGDLHVWSNASLTNIDELSNLTTVGGYVYFLDNDALTNINGLSNVTSIGGYLKIRINNALTKIDGLTNLTSIGGDLDIGNNDALTNINGLSNLTSIGGYLKIRINNALTNIDGLTNLTSIGGYLDIGLHANLTNIDGLSNLTAIPDYVQISDNTALTNIDGLSNVTSIGGNLKMVSNHALINVDGFSSLTSILGYVEINNHSVLLNVDGFSSLISIGSSLSILENPALKNVDGFSSLTSIGAMLYLFKNISLLNVDGFSSLTSIGSDLNILANPAMINLDGLSNLTTINNLHINHNDALTNVNGLSNITSVSGFFRLIDNALLCQCCAVVNILPGVAGAISIYGNDTGCTSQPEVVAAGSCELVEVVPKVFLQGPFNGTNMNTTLGSASLIPLNDPYGMGESVTSIPADAVDWIVIEIRSATAPAKVIESRAAFLLTNGDIVGTDGTSPIPFSLAENVNYHVAIRHRNHLGIMTGTPISF